MLNVCQKFMLRKVSPSPGFDPRTVQPVASRCTDWAVAAVNIRSTEMRRESCIGLMWIIIGSNGGILWTWQRTVGVHKKKGIPWPTEKLAACKDSDKTPCSVFNHWQRCQRNRTLIIIIIIIINISKHNEPNYTGCPFYRVPAHYSYHGISRWIEAFYSIQLPC
jgi:hypothetical protein